MRHRLSLVLKAVVAQQLLPSADGTGRIAVVDIMRVTPAIANQVASGRTAQIYSAIESGREIGMQTFDQALAHLARERLIQTDDGRRLARDPINFDRAYYLEPGSGAAKPYVLLRQALQETERTAVVMMSIRKCSRLALLRVRGDVIVLQTMLWPDEVRVPEFAGISDDDVAVRPQELAMAGSLVESLAADFDPSKYHDEYREAVLELLAQRLEGQDVILPSEPAKADDSGTVVDLMAALQESVRRNKAARDEDADEEPSEGGRGKAEPSGTTAGGRSGRRSGAAAATKRPARKKAAG